MTDTTSLTINFLDVGQGDCVVAVLPDGHSAILIDSAPGPAALDFLLDKRIDRLPLVVASHTHRDHVGSLLNTLRSFNGSIGIVLCNADAPLLPGPSTYRDLLEGLAELGHGGVELSPAESPYSTQLGNVEVGLLHPTHADLFAALTFDEPYRTDLASVVLRISYRGRAVLLPGDLPKRGWGWLSQRNPIPRSDVLMFPHHGGSYVRQDQAAEGPELTEILAAISPDVVVVSVGTNNTHNHPLPESFECLRATVPAARVLCTQVTPRCAPNAAEVRQAVIERLPPENGNGNSFRNVNACPCAGTVIVAMSETGLRVSPTLEQQAQVRELFPTPMCMAQGVAG